MSLEKTMKSWPKAIHSAKDLPANYLPNFEKIEYTRFPYSILIPKDVKGKEEVPESLISLFEDKVTVFENSNELVTSLNYEFDNILYIEFGVILLYSWVKIHGYSDGKVKTSNLIFNSVQEDLFYPIIKAARKRNMQPLGDEINRIEQIDYLKKLNLKLYNYTKRGLMEGQTILHSIFQPRIKESLFKLFNRVKSETSITILTNEELIVVHEPEKLHSTDEHKGVVWQFIALDSIEKLYVKDNDKETLNLILELKDGGTLDYLYSLLNLKDLEELRAKFKQIKNKS